MKTTSARPRTHRHSLSVGADAGDAHRPESSSSPKAPATGSRRARRVGLFAGAAMLAVLATGCFPSGPVESWVPDYDGNGRITANEVEWRKGTIINALNAAVEADRVAVQRHPFLTCIRHHESDRGSYPHTRGYGAQNPRSSASGGYQFLDSTWRNVSARAGHGGYSRAMHAPWYVQDAVAMYLYNNGGRSAWRGSGC